MCQSSGGMLPTDNCYLFCSYAFESDKRHKYMYIDIKHFKIDIIHLSCMQLLPNNNNSIVLFDD